MRTGFLFSAYQEIDAAPTRGWQNNPGFYLVRSRRVSDLSTNPRLTIESTPRVWHRVRPANGFPLLATCLCWSATATSIVSAVQRATSTTQTYNNSATMADINGIAKQFTGGSAFLLPVDGQYS